MWVWRSEEWEVLGGCRKNVEDFPGLRCVMAMADEGLGWGGVGWGGLERRVVGVGRLDGSLRTDKETAQ